MTRHDVLPTWHRHDRPS